MSKGVAVIPEIKALIIDRVKKGEWIDDLAREFKLYPNTIRKWLAVEGGVSGVKQVVDDTGQTTTRNQRSTILLLAKAEREKQDLINIIGELTVQIRELSKKKDR